MLHFLKRRRREQIRKRPFPPEWKQILEQRFWIYHLLPLPDRQKIDGHIQVFLAEKHFEGCGGQLITDEVRFLIAAQACLLLLHQETDYFPEVRSILVYPTTFVARQSSEKWELTEPSTRTFAGLASPQGTVILAWDAVVAGASGWNDGANVVLHEFAHQLDFEDGLCNGVPFLSRKEFTDRRRKLKDWSEAFSVEFTLLQRAASEGTDTLLSQYGATNAAEFFAVATECFFTKPWEFKRRHAKIYEQLNQYFGQDPTTYLPDSSVRVWLTA